MLGGIYFVEPPTTSECHYRFCASTNEVTITNRHDDQECQLLSYDFLCSSNEELFRGITHPLLQILSAPDKAREAIVVVDGCASSVTSVLLGDLGVLRRTSEALLHMMSVSEISVSCVTLEGMHDLRDELQTGALHSSPLVVTNDEEERTTIRGTTTRRLWSLEDLSHVDSLCQRVLESGNSAVVSFTISFSVDGKRFESEMIFVALVACELVRVESENSREGLFQCIVNESTRRCTNQEEQTSPLLELIHPGLAGMQPAAWISCFGLGSYESYSTAASIATLANQISIFPAVESHYSYQKSGIRSDPIKKEGMHELQVGSEAVKAQSNLCNEQNESRRHEEPPCRRSSTLQCNPHQSEQRETSPDRSALCRCEELEKFKESVNYTINKLSTRVDYLASQFEEVRALLSQLVEERKNSQQISGYTEEPIASMVKSVSQLRDDLHHATDLVGGNPTSQRHGGNGKSVQRVPTSQAVASTAGRTEAAKWGETEKTVDYSLTSMKQQSESCSNTLGERNPNCSYDSTFNVRKEAGEISRSELHELLQRPYHLEWRRHRESLLNSSQKNQFTEKSRTSSYSSVSRLGYPVRLPFPSPLENVRPPQGREGRTVVTRTSTPASREKFRAFLQEEPQYKIRHASHFV